jgi:uncharacterized protein with NRDE domain
MCLLVMVSRVDPDSPLVVGANRDERLDRKASAMTVLRDAAPRILGGRDEEAGGTWLAVNEHGVVAGLTNRPSPSGRRDPTRRTRGELPLALAGHRDATSAVEDFVTRFAPADYNPAWLLVGDRDSLFALDMTAGDRPVATALGPGVWILENNPLGSPSPKVDQVRALLGDVGTMRGGALVERLRSVLTDHRVPDTGEPATSRSHGSKRSDGSGEPNTRPAETLAACVHTDSYGTRSSTVVCVPVADSERPRILVADGHPCTAPFSQASHLWDAPLVDAPRTDAPSADTPRAKRGRGDVAS